MQLNPRTVPTPATDVEFLASKHMITKAVTLDAETVTADDNGDKTLRAGTVLGEITASGLYGPYDAEAEDGRSTAACILLNTVNLRHGNAAAAALTHGVVLEARLTGIDAAAKEQLSRIEFR